jgi:hypothetical protein
METAKVLPCMDRTWLPHARKVAYNKAMLQKVVSGSPTNFIGGGCYLMTL